MPTDSTHLPRGETALAGPTIVTDARTIEAICRFRESVWRETGALSSGAFRGGGWRDEFDDISRHWIFTFGSRIVAAARLSLHDRLAKVPEAEEYLRAGLRLEGVIAAPARMVVCRSMRRRGLASTLVDVQHEAAIEAGAAYGVRQASPSMCRLLTRRGWRRVAAASPDPRFPGVEFEIMVRRFEPK
jgi:GNAT superfamily N-acetyltransferase